MDVITSSGVRHRTSHHHLLTPAVMPGAGRSPRSGYLDAIIVPASRPASALEPTIALSAVLGCAIVVLCSRQANVDEVMSHIGRTTSARGMAVHIDDEYRLLDDSLLTMTDRFRGVSAQRTSDLSAKRNFGLLLARRMGWTKVVFLDDDITVGPHDIRRLAHLLDRYPVAGMMCREFPDNSVVCHARRHAGFSQDVFVTGAVLGVHIGDHPLPFFPDIYNEDWFSFSSHAAKRSLPNAGLATQAPYNPYASPARAAQEEFGDLVAEGVYALFATQDPWDTMSAILHRATERYWEDFITVRRTMISETSTALRGLAQSIRAEVDLDAADKSLGNADGRYTDDHHPITAAECCEFIEAWRRDSRIWARHCSRISAANTVDDALRSLNVTSSLVDRQLARSE